MRLLKILLIALPLIFIFSHSNSQLDSTYYFLQKHVTYLASNKLRGRFPLTIGDSLARNYIDSVYQSLGLSDLTHNHFQQRFNYLQTIKPQCQFEVCVKNQAVHLQRKKDFTIFPESGNGTITDAKVVLVGYGDSTYLHQINRYFKNKLIIGYLFPPKTIDQERPKKYHWRILIELAERYGAKGLLFIAPEAKFERLKSLEERYPYSQRIKQANIPLLTISRMTLKRILHFNQLNLDSLEQIIKDRNGHFFLQLTSISFSLSITLQFVYRQAANLIGFLKASKSNERDFILIGAHYDHLLPKKEIGTQDSIRNGADDNASGVALLLELARTFAKTSVRKFNLLFACFGAEESGLIGSTYFVQNPVIDLKRIRFMINLDMVGRMRNNTLYIKCSPQNLVIQNQLKRIQSSKFNLMINKIDALTDAIPFFKQNIQTMWISTGFHEDQHRVTDEGEKINFEGMVKIHHYVNELLKKWNRFPPIK